MSTKTIKINFHTKVVWPQQFAIFNEYLCKLETVFRSRVFFFVFVLFCFWFYTCNVLLAGHINWFKRKTTKRKMSTII